MKKIAALITVLAMILILFSACTAEDTHPAAPVITDTTTASTAATTEVSTTAAATTAAPETTTTAATTAAPETSTSESVEEISFTVLPEDGFDDAGFTMYPCETTGVYRFDCLDCGDDVKWTIYVLDEEFEEAVRYIPQAEEPALEGSGKIAIEEGQYIYIQCNVNGFTDITAPENCRCEVTLIG